MNTKQAFAVALIFTLTSGAASATQLKVSGDGDFVATGNPGHIKIHGVGKGVTGSLTVVKNQVSGTLTFPLTTLDSGVGLRDEHMKNEFIEVAKFPEATLALKNLDVKGDPQVEGYQQTKLPFTGTFTVRGVSNPVSGTIDLVTKSGETQGDAEFSMEMTKFKFREAKFLGMSVEDKVIIKAHIQAKK